jgi:hypothetical protein
MITPYTTATSADVRAFGGFASAFGGHAMGMSAAPSASACAAAVVVGERRERATAERFLAPAHLPQHDDTTLGIHSPGRPQS